MLIRYGNRILNLNHMLHTQLCRDENGDITNAGVTFAAIRATLKGPTSEVVYFSGDDGVKPFALLSNLCVGSFGPDESLYCRSDLS